jgi:hypothetical protein
VSVLRKPDVAVKYRKHFVGAQADFSDLELDDKDPGHSMVARHNPRKLRPVIVFLNHQGKEITRHTGKLTDEKDALLLARFVVEKHYLKTDWRTFRYKGG